MVKINSAGKMTSSYLQERRKKSGPKNSPTWLLQELRQRLGPRCMMQGNAKQDFAGRQHVVQHAESASQSAHSSRSGRNGHSNTPLRCFQNKAFDSFHSSWSRIILSTNSKSLDGSNSIKISKSISSVIPRKVCLILGGISREIFVNITFFK